MHIRFKNLKIFKMSDLIYFKFFEVSRSSFPRFSEVVFRSDESASSPDGK